MRKAAIFLFCISFLSLWQGGLFALHRGHDTAYCAAHLHEKLATTDPKIKKLIDLIPESDCRCQLRYCNKCGNEVVNRSIFTHVTQLIPLSEQIAVVDYCPCLEKARVDFARLKITRAAIIAMNENRQKSIKRCKKNAVFGGYVRSEKYRSFFESHAQYVKENPDCTCYWQESSKTLTAVYDKAYIKLDALLYKFAFPIKNNLGEFLSDAHKLLDQCILFSHYYYVLKELQEESLVYHDRFVHQTVCEDLNDILSSIAEDFAVKYQKCLKHHPHEKIRDELQFLRDLQGIPEPWMVSDMDTYSKSIPKSLSKKRIGKNVKSGLLASDMYLARGSSYNDCMLYSAALEVLNRAIELKPTNSSAYLERAFAYFELGAFDKAIADYKLVRKNKDGKTELHPKCYIFYPNVAAAEKATGIADLEGAYEYSNGFTDGLRKGVKESARNFFPSVLGTITGITQGLWALGHHPIDTSHELYETALVAYHYIRSQPFEATFLDIFPELKDMKKNWERWDLDRKGRADGYFLGKYGLDIFSGKLMLSGIQYMRGLRRAMTMQTLECCVQSAESKKVILSEASKRIALHKDLAKSGKIFVKSANVRHHVMQKKHAWDKVIKLSGDSQEDFQKVVNFLEKNHVAKKENIINIEYFPEESVAKTVQLVEYSAKIDNETIHAFFEVYIETGEIFLKNAWVNTKK